MLFMIHKNCMLHCSNEQPFYTLSNGCVGKAGVIGEHVAGRL
jgi:hypothetical protein